MGSAIPGATSSHTSVLTDLNASMAGSYLATVSNDFGTVASSTATLIVLDSYFTTDGLQLWLDAADVDGNGLADSIADGVKPFPIGRTSRATNTMLTQATETKRPIVKLAAMNGKGGHAVRRRGRPLRGRLRREHPEQDRSSACSPTITPMQGTPRGPIYQNKNLIESGFFPSL